MTTRQELRTARVEYVRRMYDRAINWYQVAEGKAQLILTVNGVFATIAFGLSSTVFGAGRPTPRLGPETWVFLAVAVCSLCGSIVCAAVCLQSRHQSHRHTDFAQLGIDPDDESTYTPEVLWYYGHIARLPWRSVVERLRTLDDDFELTALTYNVHGLAKVVLRKHRLINLGWALTATGPIALVAAATSFVVRSALR